MHTLKLWINSAPTYSVETQKRDCGNFRREKKENQDSDKV